jgi:Lon protease-like protein
MENVFHQRSNLPDEVPVMALRETLLIPHSMLPLRIFEERYRQMLAHCLQHDRMFCVALVKQGVSEWHTVDDFHHVAGVGLVRVARQSEDGTSLLVLQGIARVKLVNFVQHEPFPIAEIRELAPLVPNEIEAEALGVKVLELVRNLQEKTSRLPEKVARDIAHLSNPAILADVVTNTFIADPFRRQNILEQAVVSERLRMLIHYLQREISRTE